MKRKTKIIIFILCIVTILISAVSCIGNQPGNGADNGTANEPVLGPEPTITVFTEFPTGTVIDGRVDVTYEALPSEGAYITEVYYSINGERRNTIYQSGGNNNTLLDNKLGEGFVYLKEGENHIVITAVDSLGKMSQFIVENAPYRDLGEKPNLDDRKTLPSKRGDHVEYIPDLIFISVEADVLREKVEEIIAHIGCEIIAWEYGDWYHVQVPESTEDELEAMCVLLEQKYPEEILYTLLLHIYDIDAVLQSSTTEDPWRAEEPTEEE
jgi:hypothetical protein